MTALALLLVLISAALHAGWNLLLKSSSNKEAFTFLLLWAAALMLFPLWLYFCWHGQGIPAIVWPWLLTSAAAEVLYYVLLGAAYRTGDLSLVYPMARGTGALLTPIWAAIWLGEKLTTIGLWGIIFVLAGLFILHLPERLVSDLRKAFIRSHPPQPAASWGELFTASQFAIGSGICISIYSVMDKAAVSVAPVLPYLVCVFLLTAAGFTPYALFTCRDAIAGEWRRNRRACLLAGLATWSTYGLVLWAMTLAKVSYISPARESSLLFGILFGQSVLGEHHSVSRLLGAAFIVSGIVCIALAR